MKCIQDVYSQESWPATFAIDAECIVDDVGQLGKYDSFTLVAKAVDSALLQVPDYPTLSSWLLFFDNDPKLVQKRGSAKLYLCLFDRTVDGAESGIYCFLYEPL